MSRRHEWDPTCDPPRDLVRPVRVDPAGRIGPTRGQAAGPRWRQTSRGLYVPATVDASRPEQRILEASMLLPVGGAVTGWAALRLLGGNFFDGLLPDRVTQRPVPLIAGPGQSRRPRDGVVWMEDHLGADEVIVRHGIPCAIAERAVFDAMRKAVDHREATVDMDMAAAAKITSLRRMHGYVSRRGGTQGIGQARRALDLADEHSLSPNETRMRLIWVIDAGLPRPLVNRSVWTRGGRRLGIPDLLDVAAGVVGEFDGADHRKALRQSSDVGREAGFRDHLLEFYRVVGLDLPHRQRVVARMTSARNRARWLPADQRPWFVREDDPAESLDAVLDERDRVRELRQQWERDGDPDIRDIVGGDPW